MVCLASLPPVYKKISISGHFEIQEKIIQKSSRSIVLHNQGKRFSFRDCFVLCPLFKPLQEPALGAFDFDGFDLTFQKKAGALPATQFVCWSSIRHN